VARKILAAIGLVAAWLSSAAIAAAADWPVVADGPRWPNIPAERVAWPTYAAPRTLPAYDGEFGLRYWYSWGSTAKDLYNTTGAYPVSRLTYDDFKGHSGEIFGRTDFTSGFFLKGYGGLGILAGGGLDDEDFPPVISPYSSTLSDQKDGHLAYLTFDSGLNLFRTPSARLGVFAGYHFLDQKVSAYGCSQIAGNAAVCAPAIPTSTLVITQGNRWHALRVGGDAELRFAERWKLSADAAYLPYVKLNGADSHWLRIGTDIGDFAGAIPEDGKGHGYQLEAALSYDVSKDVSVAIGGRYWRMQTNGDTHFENNVVGQVAYPQPVRWKTENMGVFIQGSFKFGPYPSGSGY
jgi:opacity protein-like surface antigen